MAEDQTAVLPASPGRDVFVSYASQDATVANAIVEALEKTGIKCWIAPRDVRPGMVYADAIVGAINESKALALVLSANAMPSAHVGREVERAASKHKQLIAFRVDTAPLSQELEYFLSNSQWIAVPQLGMPAALTMLAESVRQRAGTASAAACGPAAPTSRKPVLASWRSKAALFATIAVLLAALGYLMANRFVPAKRGAGVEAASGSATQTAPATALSPPARSVAVLPFVNMSGDKEQEYFSDGLTEEILNSLVRINELQVCARTSSFSFKDKDTDVRTIARKLNVGAILEGSVRRSGRTVRITTQLVNAETGFHLWSETYDRDLRDVLKVQTEIATAVARALKVTLLGNVAATSELGGTSNPDALDAYLRAGNFQEGTDKGLLAAAAAYTDALRLDPGYASALVGRSFVSNEYAANWATGSAVNDGFAKSGDDARRAIALAPDLGEAHLALAYYYTGTLDLPRADEEYARASSLAPGSAFVVGNAGVFMTQMGRIEAGLEAVHQALLLDPLNAGWQGGYGYALYLARRYEAALTAYGHAITVYQGSAGLQQSLRGLVYYALGDFKQAASSCQNEYEGVDTMVCLAVTYEKLGRHADAQAMLAKFMKQRGDADAYAYAEIYAQWGDTHNAFAWLEKAVRLRDSGLILVKTDPLMDPLRRDPRYKAIERELKFPD